MQFRTSAVGMAAALTLSWLPPAEAAGVLNGGFETGNFIGWTVGGGLGFTGVDSFAAKTGSFGAYFGEDAPGSSISQTVTTVIGTLYLVEFWVQLDDSAIPNAFSWSFGGMAQPGSLTNAAGFDYRRASALITATSTTSNLQFNFLNQQSYYLLDDVSVTAVPEPTALVLFIAGLGGILVARRRNAIHGT